MIKFFITGTDTNIGKTHISVGLLKKFNQLGKSTLGIKLISAGCIRKNNTLINNDAKLLLNESSIKVGYQVVNPFAYEPAIAPHIAANLVNETITVKTVSDTLSQTLHTYNFVDSVFIEGAGGWHLPLNNKECMSDVIAKLNIPIILVVGMKLGCLNHAILTYRAIKSSNLCIVGWIANSIDSNMDALNENIATLKSIIKEPCLGIVPYGKQAKYYLHLDTLFNNTSLS